tara:strand:+ start:145 stop:531 length:387 start_codon:yes stop_codon:yes gene_type:complete
MERKEVVFWIIAVFVLINLIVIDIVFISALGFMGDAVMDLDRRTREDIDDLDFKLESNIDPCDVDLDCEKLWDKKGITCDDMVSDGTVFNGSLICGNNLCECRGTFSHSGTINQIPFWHRFFSGIFFG